MKVTQTGRQDEIARTFAITDGPVLPFPYSSAGKTFRVKEVTITYRREGESWNVLGSYSIRLVGPVLKKDGTEGKEIYNGWPESGALEDLPHYQWLRSLIGAARLVGQAAAFAVNDLTLKD